MGRGAGQRARFWRMMRKSDLCHREWERERLEPTAQENRRRVDMFVCGCGFVRSFGGRCVVDARDELLHGGLLPDRGASSPQEAGVAAC